MNDEIPVENDAQLVIDIMEDYGLVPENTIADLLEAIDADHEE